MEYKHFSLRTKALILASSLLLNACGGGGNSGGRDEIDSDGDGVVDSKDAFPDNPHETMDSDGDGVGDNADFYPNDPNISVHTITVNVEGLAESESVVLSIADQELTVNADRQVVFTAGRDVPEYRARIIQQPESQRCWLTMPDIWSFNYDFNQNYQDYEETLYCLDRQQISSALTKINDENLRSCLNSIAVSREYIYVDEVEYIDCRNREIKSTWGIEQFKWAKRINLSNNLLTNAFFDEPMGVLSLSLNGNALNFVGFYGLGSIINLNISSTTLIDLTISNKIHLQGLNATQNLSLDSLVVSGSPYLKELWLTDSPINDFELSRFEYLERLAISTPLDFGGLLSLQHLRLENMNSESLDLSTLVELTDLDISNFSGETLDLTFNQKLSQLDMTNVNIQRAIDFSENTLLDEVTVKNSSVIGLDFTFNIAITEITTDNNDLEYLRFGDSAELLYLSIDDKQLPQVDLSSLAKLGRLYLNVDNWSEIDVSENANIWDLFLFSDSATSIQLGNKPKLRLLNIGAPNISSIDLSKFTTLETLWLSDMDIERIDLSSNPLLEHVILEDNQLNTVPVGITSIVDNNAYIFLHDNNFSAGDIDELSSLKSSYPNIRWQLSIWSVWDINKIIGLTSRYR